MMVLLLLPSVLLQLLPPYFSPVVLQCNLHLFTLLLPAPPPEPAARPPFAPHPLEPEERRHHPSRSLSNSTFSSLSSHRVCVVCPKLQQHPVTVTRDLVEGCRAKQEPKVASGSHPGSTDCTLKNENFFSKLRHTNIFSPLPPK